MTDGLILEMTSMFLKSIELQGFKSFAKKTKITFTEPITAIVGPNGSGKSNILDAITWALGETRVKSLRGSKMADVIFSGTNQRKAQGFADVILCFDNSTKWLDIPYNEVLIQRRMYRSGESEFRINQELCRLKDIQELFMDTGIGKDGYSFIGQGRIDAVLSNKPEDRRMVFEEAAGITKFKKRKNESIKKLQDTLDNLNRIEDLLDVLKKQEGNLSKDLEKYQAYQSLYEERKSLDGDFFFLKHQDYLKKKDKINEEMKTLEEEIQDIEKEINKKEALYEKQEKDLTAKETEVESHQEKLQKTLEDWVRLEEKKDRYQDQKTAVIRSIDFDKKNIQDLRQSQERNQEALENLEKDRETTVDREKDLERKLASFKNSLSAKKEKLKELISKETELKDHLDQLAQSKVSLEFRKETKEQMIQEALDRIEKRKHFVENLSQEISRLNQEKKSRQEELSQLEKKGEKDGEGLRNLSLQVKSNEGNLQTLDEEIKKLNIDRQELIRARSFLKNTMDHYDGFNRSVKSFLRVCNQENLYKKEILGPVANLFQVDKTYEIAMSVALGYALQNIVVSDDSHVKEMIQLLKDRSIGRITFLPLNRYRAYSFSGPAPQGSIGYARDFIRCEDKLSNLFHQLLGDVLFVETYNDGLKLSKKVKKKIISLQGDLFHPKGSITGGSLQRGSVQILNQTKKIEEKDQAIEEVEKIIKRKNQSWIKGNEEKEALKLAYQKAALDLGELKERTLKNKQEIQSLDQNILLQNQQKQGYEEEIAQMKEDVEREKTSYKDYLNQLETSEDQEEIRKTFLAVQEKKGALSRLVDDENDQLIQLRIEKTEINASLDFQKAEMKRLLEEKNKISASMETSKNRLDNNQKIQEDIEDKLLQWEVSYQEDSQKLQEAKDFLEGEKKAFGQLAQNVQNLRQDITKEKEDKQKKEQTLERKEFSIEKLTMEYDNHKSRFLERYGIMKETLLKRDVQGNEREISKKLEALNHKMESFGPINEGVMEEYQDLKNRIDFQEKQKLDLVEAKEELDQVIESLDRKMRKAFVKSFEEITGYFSHIFKELFQGGTANIELEEGPILEAGIDIKAQPPGKKLQSLSLLSGGERSLTAVALIFALLKYRPAPFCILDEIDAALDDANIDRYVDYVKNLDDIQFMMITHRKPTMEIADVLYGVTMEEKGISTIVPMKLKNM